MNARRLILTWAALTAVHSAAQNAAPRAAAETALARFVEIGEPMHLPFIGVDEDADFIALDASSAVFGFGEMERRGEVDFPVLSAPVITADQVHFIGGISEQDESGATVSSDRLYVVMTQVAGNWGVQLIAVLSEPTSDAGSVQATQSTIEKFFTAWNAADNDAIHDQVNFPHVFLTREGRASIANTPDELITDFGSMREREGWAKSEYHGFEVIHADDLKVIAKLTFTRHRADGTIYQTVPVVWIITNVNGHWGLQVRCILPAVQRD